MNPRPILAALLLLLPGACGPAPHETRLPIRMRVEPTDTLVPGQTLRMTAWLHNPTRQELRLEFGDQCRVEIYVQGPDMSILHPPGRGASCVGAPSELVLPARDSVRFEGSWMATTAVLGDHIAYAVLWPHRIPHDRGVAEREGHRSNVVIFPVRVPE